MGSDPATVPPISRVKSVQGKKHTTRESGLQSRGAQVLQADGHTDQEAPATAAEQLQELHGAHTKLKFKIRIVKNPRSTVIIHSSNTLREININLNSQTCSKKEGSRAF